jgi:hypothetical protein
MMILLVEEVWTMGYDRLVWLGMRLIRRVIQLMIYEGVILLGIVSWREFYVLLMGFMCLIKRDDLIKHGLVTSLSSRRAFSPFFVGDCG